MGQWQSQPVCNAPACLHVASTILKNLAPNWAEMDPCTEFDKSKLPLNLSRGPREIRV